MPEGDTIFKAAERVRSAIGGQSLFGVAIPRVRSAPPAPGVTVLEVTSRGKYLVVALDDDHVIVTHLMMTGAWKVLPADRPPPTARLRVWLATRQQGAACIDAPVAELLDVGAYRRHPGLRGLGPDLCTMDLADAGGALDDIIARGARHALRGAPVTDLLLDQRVAAGIGNVYKSEICFLHGLHPATPVEAVPNELRRELFATGAQLLQDNLATTVRTTVPGARPGSLWVYGRVGRACRRCGTAIEVERTGRHSRLTSWCPSCQPGP